MNRKISLSIEDIYIKYAGEAFGTTGSHNAVTLRMIFGAAWDGTAKTAYFTDALGSASVSIVLGLDKLVGGAYEVDVPSEALKYAGEATVTIKGVLTSGDTTTKAITTAAGHFRVLDSELPDSAGNAGTITPSDKDQLQAEIAGLENLFTTTKTAAETAAENAKVSEANAKASETAAASSASSAEASKATAAASANTAGSAAAAAVKNASHAAESAKAAENTAKSIVTEEAARQAAEKVRQANETIRQNAESARQTAETNRAQTETARNVWEDYDSAKNYQPGNKAYWQGSSYVCLKACSGISPENGTYWQLVVRSGFTSDSAFGFDVVNGRLLCYYSGDNPPPFRLGSDGHLHVDLDKSYDLGKVAGDGGYSPTAKVEETADGAKISITDKDGTTEATVKNGKDGADGAPGKDGTNGTNGITPTIGDNGNWYLGNTDTGKPSRGPAGQDGAGMDVTGAAVGQIVKISAVDTAGKPTAWEPTDLPSGGEDNWELIQSTTLEEDTASVVYSTDANGDPFELKKMKLVVIGTGNNARLNTRVGTDAKNNFGVYDYGFFPANQTANNPNIVGEIIYHEHESGDLLLKYEAYPNTLMSQLYQTFTDRSGGAFPYAVNRYPYRYITAYVHNGVFFAGCRIELYGVRA